VPRAVAERPRCAHGPPSFEVRECLPWKHPYKRNFHRRVVQPQHLQKLRHLLVGDLDVMAQPNGGVHKHGLAVKSKDEVNSGIVLG
jgi:hypothetical protein